MTGAVAIGAFIVVLLALIVLTLCFYVHARAFAALRRRVESSRPIVHEDFTPNLGRPRLARSTFELGPSGAWNRSATPAAVDAVLPLPIHTFPEPVAEDSWLHVGRRG